MNRKSYIYRSFFLSVVLFVVQGILSFAAETFGALDLLFSIVAFVLGIFQLAANIMMGVRRLHDLDKCGWWMLLLLVPLVNLFFCRWLIFSSAFIFCSSRERRGRTNMGTTLCSSRTAISI